MMLSRFASRSAMLKSNSYVCTILTKQSSSVVEASSKSTEVTFERAKPPMYSDKVRMGFIPDKWFQFFYHKTGVTGPYVFGGSFLTFLMSKEFIVFEHETFSIFPVTLITVVAVKKFGPALREWVDTEIDKEVELVDSLRDNEIMAAEEEIKQAKEAQEAARNQDILFTAKRENIGLQLEAIYRQRLVDVHSMVKKKLDYQLETSNVKTKFEHRHMVQWIVENVRKSITSAQEAASLKGCMANLKEIAAKA